jgi:uncharacterized protein (DUF433 family)
MKQATQRLICHPTHGFAPQSSHGRYAWRGYDKPPLMEREFGYKDSDVLLSDVFEQSLQGRPSVAIDHDVLGGTPHMAGTRIPVFMVLDAVEYHGTLEGALKSYPRLTIEQVKDAVSFAAAVTEHPVDYEVESPTR